MIPEHVLSSLATETDSKLVLVVIDGLGGLPIRGKTELERAQTPHLDRLASKSMCGLVEPLGCGITPGSGPSHLALFGYDPFSYEIGRGVMEALGMGIHLTRSDLTARGNFATIDREGVIRDRRAGRIPSEKTRELCQYLQEQIPQIGGVKISIHPGKEHRFVVLFQGEALKDDLSDADPQKDGFKAKMAEPLCREAEKTAEVVNVFLVRARQVLESFHPANAVLLRGFSKVPEIPTLQQRFKIRPAAVATYPMYRGLARLVGMEVLETGETLKDEIETLREHFSRYDFFYLHFKKTDSAGEDGNFGAKVKALEEIDRVMPALLKIRPHVLVVTGDHSTPALLKAHSWHPNPLLLHSAYVRPDRIRRFTERDCQKGQLGTLPATSLMPLMLAHGLKLKKFGA